MQKILSEHLVPLAYTFHIQVKTSIILYDDANFIFHLFIDKNNFASPYLEKKEITEFFLVWHTNLMFLRVPIVIYQALSRLVLPHWCPHSCLTSGIWMHEFSYWRVFYSLAGNRVLYLVWSQSFQFLGWACGNEFHQPSTWDWTSDLSIFDPLNSVHRITSARFSLLYGGFRWRLFCDNNCVRVSFSQDKRLRHENTFPSIAPSFNTIYLCTA